MANKIILKCLKIILKGIILRCNIPLKYRISNGRVLMLQCGVNMHTHLTNMQMSSSKVV